MKHGERMSDLLAKHAERIMVEESNHQRAPINEAPELRKFRLAIRKEVRELHAAGLSMIVPHGTPGATSGRDGPHRQRRGSG